MNIDPEGVMILNYDILLDEKEVQVRLWKKQNKCFNIVKRYFNFPWEKQLYGQANV